MILSNFQGLTHEVVVLCRWKANPILASISWDTSPTLGEISPSGFSLLSLHKPQDVTQALEFLKTEGLDTIYWTHICLTLIMSDCRPCSLSTNSSKWSKFFFSQYMTHKQTSWGRNEVRNRKVSTTFSSFGCLWSFTVSHDLPASQSLFSSLCTCLKLLGSPLREWHHRPLNCPSQRAEGHPWIFPLPLTPIHHQTWSSLSP